MSKHNLKDWLSTKKLVVIEWLDAASKDEWHSPKDPCTAQACITCGILLSEDDAALTITHTYGIDGNGDDCDTCCSISIPKGCVVSAYEIPSAGAKIIKVKPRRKQCKK